MLLNLSSYLILSYSYLKAKGYDGPYPGWYWESSSDLDGFPFKGLMATYGGGGFNLELGTIAVTVIHF